MDLLSALGTVGGQGLHILELWVLAAPWDKVYGRVQALRVEAVSEKTGQEWLSGGSGWPMQAHQDLHK